MQGTVKILVEDVKNGTKCYVFLHNVLYVPGITRRLISAQQWNITGGDIYFSLDHCTLTICNKASGECVWYAVRPPYDSTEDDLHSSETNASHTTKPKYVDLLLLQKRMGRISLPELLNASKNAVWNDTKMEWGNDRTCDEFKITTSRKVRRGATTTVDALKVTRTGKKVTMDIIINFETKGLSSKTHSKYNLLVCDVYSRFTVFLGMNDKSSITIVDTLLAWIATYHAPTPPSTLNHLQMWGLMQILYLNYSIFTRTATSSASMCPMQHQDTRIWMVWKKSHDCPSET